MALTRTVHEPTNFWAQVAGGAAAAGLEANSNNPMNSKKIRPTAPISPPPICILPFTAGIEKRVRCQDGRSRVFGPRRRNHIR